MDTIASAWPSSRSHRGGSAITFSQFMRYAPPVPPVSIGLPALGSAVRTLLVNVQQGRFHVRHEGATPEEDDARRFVGLLRRGGNEATKLDELRDLAGTLLIDANVLLSLACTYISEDDAIQFLNRFLHARSQASRAATADSRAAEVRREIDDLRRREGDLPNSVLATRLNALGIPAPRGGAWSGAQVYRVLKRTGGAHRPGKDTPATKRARPPSAP